MVQLLINMMGGEKKSVSSIHIDISCHLVAVAYFFIELKTPKIYFEIIYPLL